MNLRTNPSSLHKILVKFVEVVYFEQIFRLHEPPTLPKTNLLANRHFSSIHLSIDNSSRDVGRYFCDLCQFSWNKKKNGIDSSPESCNGKIKPQLSSLSLTISVSLSLHLILSILVSSFWPLLLLRTMFQKSLIHLIYNFTTFIVALWTFSSLILLTFFVFIF